MNEDNKRFVEEFKTRTSPYESYGKRMVSIHNMRNDISSIQNKTFNFIQKSVMGTSTASLRKFNIELEENNEYYKNKNISKKLFTVNHKGIGYIRIATGQDYVSGTTMSNELKDNELIELLNNSTLRQQIIDAMIKEKAMKLLKHFNDTCSVGNELSEMYKIYENVEYSRYGHQNNPSNKLESTESIINLDINYTTDGIYAPEINKLDVIEIEFIDNNSFLLKTSNDSDIKFGLNELKTTMILMQIPKEFDESLTKVEKELSEKYNRIKFLESEVESKLAPYAMMEQLKDV